MVRSLPVNSQQIAAWRDIIKAAVILGIKEHAPKKNLEVLFDVYLELVECLDGVEEASRIAEGYYSGNYGGCYGRVVRKDKEKTRKVRKRRGDENP